ncbi:MAG: poly(3-hydroxybutyrate) depolymerase [Chloroflexi bacterium]|nr:poly(3-hydroxybutyrate) depolymerase [Chloroflexota bacterium]
MNAKSASRRYFILAGLIVLATIVAACSRPGRRNQVIEPTLPSESAPNAGGYVPGDYVEEITSGGQARAYRLHVPENYRAGQPLPLIVNLHGLNSNAAQQEQVSRMSVKADQANFIVVYPEGLGDPQTWRVGPRAEGDADLQFIRDLIAYLQAQLSIDASRIYATGISNGAQMTNRLGCDMSEVIAAIAPVSGGYAPTENCRPGRPVPVVAFHGTADKILPYEGKGRLLMPIQDWASAWAKRNGCDPTATVVYQNGDVTGEAWNNCADKAEVILYTIQDKGHSWPGSDMPSDITTQDVDATDVIWAFFADHPLP